MMPKKNIKIVETKRSIVESEMLWAVISPIRKYIVKRERMQVKGRKIRRGENKVISLMMSIKVFRASLGLTVLLPWHLLIVMGTYLTFKPALKKARVIVVVREKPLGKR